MTRKDILKNISLFLNGIFFASLFFGILWADTNGVWNFAEDLNGGIIGADQQKTNMNYTFINPVYFNTSVGLKNITNCNGKLYTDSNGKILCGNDNVNDGDTVIGNEIQNLNSVLANGNNAGGQRIRNIANPITPQDVATKNYVDINTAGKWPSGSYCIWKNGNCPTGFTHKSMTLAVGTHNHDMSPNEGPIGSSYATGSTYSTFYFNACCK